MNRVTGPAMVISGSVLAAKNANNVAVAPPKLWPNFSDRERWVGDQNGRDFYPSHMIK